MLDFLQGFAFGLLTTFMPWFLAGLYEPRLVVPAEVASRWQVILRYAVAMPAVAMLLLLTSLWGGFGPCRSGGSREWAVGRRMGVQVSIAAFAGKPAPTGTACTAGPPRPFPSAVPCPRTAYLAASAGFSE